MRRKRISWCGGVDDGGFHKEEELARAVELALGSHRSVGADENVLIVSECDGGDCPDGEKLGHFDVGISPAVFEGHEGNQVRQGYPLRDEA